MNNVILANLKGFTSRDQMNPHTFYYSCLSKYILGVVQTENGREKEPGLKAD